MFSFAVKRSRSYRDQNEHSLHIHSFFFLTRSYIFYTQGYSLIRPKNFLYNCRPFYLLLIGFHSPLAMEEQFNAFQFGITWSQFGNAVRPNVDKLLDSRAYLTPEQRIAIDDLWVNHPSRQKG